jgi:hypothetical protein
MTEGYFQCAYNAVTFLPLLRFYLWLGYGFGHASLVQMSMIIFMVVVVFFVIVSFSVLQLSLLLLGLPRMVYFPYYRCHRWSVTDNRIHSRTVTVLPTDHCCYYR